MNVSSEATDQSAAEAMSSLTAEMSRFVPVSVVDLKLTNARIRSHLAPIDDIVFVDFSWGPLELARNRSDPASEPREEYVGLAAIHAGSEIVGSGEHRHILNAGDVVLWTCQAPAKIHVPQSLHKSALLVPTRVLRHLSLDSGRWGVFKDVSDAPTAPLMRQLLASISEHSDPISPSYRRMRNALVEMFLATVESHPDSSSTSLLPGLRTAVCSWIDQHLDDPELCPTKAAAAHAVSVRTLQRAFQTHAETFAEVVQIRKLERARTMLLDPTCSVTTIAARLNFANPSHFSRVFTRHTGMSPRDYRGTLLVPAGRSA